MMSRTCWEADRTLDVYIYDYFIKKKLHATAKAFQAEAKVPMSVAAIDAPGGFLLEWWSVFWDIFIASTKEKCPEPASSSIQTQLSRTRVLQKRQRQEASSPQQLQEIEMQLFLQRQAQQQQQIQKRDGIQVVNRGMSRHLQQVQNWSQQLPGRTQDMQNEMSSMMSTCTTPSEGSLLGFQGSNQGNDNMTLRGWPLTGLDQLCSPQKKTIMQSPLSHSQLHLQPELMLQQQQNLASPSANEIKSRKLQILIDNQKVSPAKIGLLDNVSQLIPRIGSSLLVGFPGLLDDADSGMLLKFYQQQLQQNCHQQQEHSHQHLHLRQQSANQPKPPEKAINGRSNAADYCMSFQGNHQFLKDPKKRAGRNRKQGVSSSGFSNSSDNANTSALAPTPPSTTSTHTSEEALLMPTVQQNVSSKSLLMFPSDGLCSLSSARNQTAQIGQRLGHCSSDDNVEPYLSPDVKDTTDGVGNFQDIGFTFKEVQLIPASTSQVECCDLSSDGKLLATGGHDRKVSIWATESGALKCNLNEHSQRITDVRFNSSMSSLATSSADKTVRIWDIGKLGHSLRTFTGHSTAVMSVDFHPSKEDTVFSCDNNYEIRCWSIKNGSLVGLLKGGATQIRFQTGSGRLLAAAVANLISIVDVETLSCRLKLQGHQHLVHSICWDSSGQYLASMSDDLIRIWNVTSGCKGECLHELKSAGNKFNACVFHPSNPVLVIGCYETLELWNFGENKRMTLPAHDNAVSSLAVSNVSGLVASASHDKCVKLWK